MYGADIVRDKLSLGQIRRTFQADCKAVKPWPVGTCLAAILNTSGREALGNGGDHRRVQSAGEQHAVRHVTHQLTLHGRHQSLTDLLNGLTVGQGSFGASLSFHPITVIIALHARILAPIVVTGQKRLVMIALSFQCFQLTGDIYLAVRIVTYIKRYHADRVAGYEE